MIDDDGDDNDDDDALCSTLTLSHSSFSIFLQFMRQNFERAVSHCDAAASALLSSGSGGDSQAYSCIGVAATYLGAEVRILCQSVSQSQSVSE
jgi:hypothetical protein